MKDKWHLNIDIPEGKSGYLKIRHINKPAGIVLPTSNSRTALMGGQKVEHIKFDEETRWHELSEEDRGVWMTDYPIEQAQCDEQSKGMWGNVLIGGLGLGYAAQHIAKDDQVDSITVVEST